MGSRVWVAIVGVLAASLLLAPFVMGFMIEEVYDEIILAAAEQSDPRYEIEGHFERGWLISRAETTLRLKSESPDEDFEVPLRHELVHGPIPLGELLRGRSPLQFLFVVADTRYDADPESLPRIAEALGSRPLLQLRAWLGFDRSASLHIHSPEFSIDDGRYSSEGLRGDVEVEQANGTAWGLIRMGALSLTEASGTLRFSGSKLHFDSRRADEPSEPVSSRITGSWEIGAAELAALDGGRSVLEKSLVTFEGGIDADGDLLDGSLDLELGDLATLDADSPNGHGMALRGVRLKESSSRSPETGTNEGSMDLSFEQLIMNGQSYGPARSLFTARNFDRDAWEDFGEALSALGQQDLSEEELAQAQIAVLGRHLPRVLGVSPELSAERIELVAPNGRLEASGRLGVDASEPDMLGNPFVLMAMIQAEARMEISAELLHELLDRYLERSAGDQAGELPPEDMQEIVLFMREATLGQLLEGGTLVRDGDLYRLDARMQEGLPYLNGQPADPSFLTGIIPGM